MLKKITFIIVLILFTLLLSLSFFLIGIYLGGNYFTNFELLGRRGYEAFGNLALIIGLVVGMIISIIFGIPFKYPSNCSIALGYKLTASKSANT